MGGNDHYDTADALSELYFAFLKRGHSNNYGPHGPNKNKMGSNY